MPEQVLQEIHNKSRAEPSRFSAATDVLARLRPSLWTVLPDDLNAELNEAMMIITNTPAEVRINNHKDLGEVMVVSHALVFARAGHHVTVLIDDGGGQRLAARAARWCERERANQARIGSITQSSTLGVLRAACEAGHIADKTELRKVYSRMVGLDDGLNHIDSTDLLKLDCWKR